MLVNPEQKPALTITPIKEEIVNPKKIGEIIHHSYGLSFDGSPAEPKTYQELKEMGYDHKEIQFALKAGAFMEAMRSMAETLDTEAFTPLEVEWESYAGPAKYQFNSPRDLLNEYGQLDHAKYRLYFKQLLQTKSNQVFTTTFKDKYPTAYQNILRVSGFFEDVKGDEADVFSALNLGVDIILAFHKAIENQDGSNQLGRSMESSLPTLYKMASHNLEAKSDPEIVLSDGLVYDPNLKISTPLRQHLLGQLRTIDPQKIVKWKNKLLDEYLEKVIRWPDTQSTNLPALEAMDLAFNDPDIFIGYLTGTQRLPSYVSSDPSVIAYYEHFSQLSTIVDLGYWLKQIEFTPSEEFLRTAEHLEREMRTLTLNPNFFEIVANPETDIIQVQLKEAPDQDPTRAKELLFRQEIGKYEGENWVFRPADLITPKSKTVRCSAMHCVIDTNKYPSVQEAMKLVDFHPAKLNGIGFVTLMDLVVTRQILKAA